MKQATKVAKSENDMGAAEEAALKLYPKEETIMYHSAFGKLEFDKNAGQRKAFMEGFRYGAKWMAEQIKEGSK